MKQLRGWEPGGSHYNSLVRRLEQCYALGYITTKQYNMLSTAIDDPEARVHFEKVSDEITWSIQFVKKVE